MTQILSVTLPSSTLYVSGTVNDLAVTWTNTEGDTWEAEAPRVPDDVYRIELSVVDSEGHTSVTSTVAYYGIQGLITDRTAQDVFRWRTLRDKGWQSLSEEEKEEWLSPMKGAYNYTDMNRVEKAVEYVSQKLGEAGYVFLPFVKTNWTMADEPTRADMDRYLRNVALIREIIKVKPTTPSAPTVNENLTHDGANRLEQILQDVGTLAENMIKSRYYSGDLFAGEV